jgi:hypothetical protein
MATSDEIIEVGLAGQVDKSVYNATTQTPAAMTTLQQALRSVTNELIFLAASERFDSVFAEAFGVNYSKAAAHAIQDQLKRGDLSQLARVEVISAAELENARAVYASLNSTIYLSDHFLAEASSTELQAVLLEELGHAIDARVNAKDPQGDEGEMFSLLVRDITPTPKDLSRIMQEDDRRTLSIHGSELVVEQAAAVIYTTSTVGLDQSSSTYGYTLSGRYATWIDREWKTVATSRLLFFDGSNTSTIAISPYARFGSLALSDGLVAYTKYDGQDYELYRFNGGVTTRVTNNAQNEDNLLAEGNTIVWQAYDPNEKTEDGQGTGEIYRNDGTLTTRITTNSVGEHDVQLSKGNILWAASDGDDYEIYLNDGLSTKALTNNSLEDYSPVLQGGQAAWLQHNNGQDNLFFYDGSSVKQVTNNQKITNPLIIGSYLAYKQQDPTGKSTLKVYSPRTGISHQLNSDNTFVTDVTAEGNYVAWVEAPVDFTNFVLAPKTLKLFDGVGTKIAASGFVLGTSAYEALRGGGNGESIRLSNSKLFYLDDGLNPPSTSGPITLLPGGSITITTRYEFWSRDLLVYEIANPNPTSANTRLTSLVGPEFRYSHSEIEELSAFGETTLWYGSYGGPNNSDTGLFLTKPSSDSATPSLPLISASVFPSLGVLEDGPSNLTFELRRTGPTNGTLRVSVTISGSADANDYAQPLDFSSTNGFVTFLPGSSTATVTIKPNPDIEFEADESITLRINPGGDYGIGSAASATAFIRDDDAYTTIEERGNTKLLRYHNGNAITETANIRREVSSPWGAKTGSVSSDWLMLAAESVGGNNQILWSYKPTNQIHTWTLDPNWAWQSSSPLINRTSPESWAIESGFQLDLNGDSIIGAPPSPIESSGNTTLLRRNDGKAVVLQGVTYFDVSSPWGASAGDANSDWLMLAAESIGSNNQILWRYKPTNQIHTWTLNANWAWQSSSPLINRNSPETLALESGFQLDLNGDSIIGVPPVPVESRGNTTLLRRNDGRAIVQQGSKSFDVSSPWGANTGDANADWLMLAAESIGSQNMILWRYKPTNQLHTWTLNPNWVWQSSSPLINRSSPETWTIESNFQLDLNGDSIIGAP